MRKRSDIFNLILAVILSTVVMLVWQIGYEMPRQKQAAAVARQQQLELKHHEQEVARAGPPKTLTQEELLTQSPRVAIRSDMLQGSIALKGLRFDDLVLAQYRETLDKNSPDVRLLSPSGNENLYFAQIGWLSADAGVKLPGAETVWSADQQQLTPAAPVMFSWDNGQGLVFRVKVSLDQHYMFTLEQQVENHGPLQVTVKPYAFINRIFASNKTHYYIMHEGPLGVLSNVLTETTYQTLHEKKEQDFNKTNGWLGITDKYWLTALIPADAPFTGHFTYYESKGAERYQVDYAGADIAVAPAQTGTTTLRFFAGAKQLPILDAYAKQFNIPLFDRAVDFGIYYFLTKPMFRALNYLYEMTGNFGVAILLLTVAVKLFMFPLANKSFVSMNQMKRLQPQLEEIKKRSKDDKLKLQQEMMALYKREKVNPAAGCLPMLIQIPVFFSLYKVLFVTLEMRQAPFALWIRDLSAPDPLNVFNLFGLIHWTPPSMLHLGILPILFCITMIIQQKLNPPPADPMQAKMFAYIPFVFLYIFSSFPAGLVLYWTWSNLISIGQQKLIAYRYDAKTGNGKKKAA